jgi:hypothetical protein
MAEIGWKKANGKFVIGKDGIYFPLKDLEEVKALKEVLEDIESGRNRFEIKDNRNKAN